MTSSDPEAEGRSVWDQVSANPKIAIAIGAVLLLLLTVVAYARTFGSGFIWDDDYYVTNNASLRDLYGLRQIWIEQPTATQYYPLVLTSFWIEHHLWGVNPVGFHIINVLIQAGNAILLWIILRRLAMPGGWLIAAIFAVHPVQVETVAWIAERKNLLSALFYFLSMIVYLRYAGITLPASPRKQLAEGEDEPLLQLPTDPTRLYALAIFMFACALLSKSVTVSLPVAIGLIIWWKRGKLTLADIKPLLPMLVLGIAMGAFTSSLEANVIGATGRGWQLAPTAAGDFGVRSMIAGKAVWFYVLKLIKPYPLIFNYTRWNLSPSDLAQYLFPVSVLVALATLFIARNKVGRGPFAAFAFFLVTLFPALSFVNFLPMRYSFVADHFQYMACIGVIALVVASLDVGVRKMVSRDLLSPAIAPLGGALLLLTYVGLSLHHSETFHDAETLWKNTLAATSEKSWMAANNYGVILLNKNSSESVYAAEKWFEKTLRLNSGHAEARYNLARIARMKGDDELALNLYRESMAQSPAYPDSEFQAVQMLMRLQRNDEALQAAKELVAHYPANDRAHGTYGLLLAQHGRMQEAIEECATAVDLAPESAIAHFNIARTLMRASHFVEALSEYAKAVQLDDANPMYVTDFGTSMIAIGRVETGRKLFERAIEIDPKFYDAYYALGMLSQTELKLDESAKYLKQAIALDAKDPRAIDALKQTELWIADPSKRPTTQTTTQAATQAATRSTTHASSQPSTAPAMLSN